MFFNFWLKYFIQGLKSFGERHEWILELFTLKSWAIEFSPQILIEWAWIEHCCPIFKCTSSLHPFLPLSPEPACHAIRAHGSVRVGAVVLASVSMECGGHSWAAVCCQEWSWHIAEFFLLRLYCWGWLLRGFCLGWLSCTNDFKVCHGPEFNWEADLDIFMELKTLH